MMNYDTLVGTGKTNTLQPIKKIALSLLDIILAYIPLAVLGIIGTRLGTGTLQGGMLVTLGYVLSIAAATGILKLSGSGWNKIGLARPNWFRTILLGIIAMIVGAVVVIAIQVIVSNLPGADVAPRDVSRFNPIEGNLPLLFGYIVLAWTTIAFGEEMFFRAFITSRLANVFQNTKIGWVFAIVGSSLAFGLAHYQEGPLGIITTAVGGLLWGAIFLGTRRNLWVTIIAHGLIDTLAFVLAFAGM